MEDEIIFSEPVDDATIDLTSEQQVVDLSDDDDVVDLTTSGNANIGTDTGHLSSYRNAKLNLPRIYLENCCIDGLKISLNNTIELEDGDFLRVKEIFEDVSNSEISFRGWRLRRSKLMSGMLPKKLNELCWLLEVDEDDSRPHGIQGMEEIQPSQIKKRRGLKMTNQNFPSMSFRDDYRDVSCFPPEQKILDDLVLACRWKFVRYFRTAMDRIKGICHQEGIYRLCVDECDPGCEAPEERLRDDWRGESPKGGSGRGPSAQEERFNAREQEIVRESFAQFHRRQFFDLTSPEPEAMVIDVDAAETEPPRPPQPRLVIDLENEVKQNRYTFGDAFCGAGGTSRGAKMAGLAVDWGFDFDYSACDTYRRNFYGTRIYNIWAHQFISLTEDHKVDVLHLSPPCQFFSPAHTVQGQNDEMNIATQFALEAIIAKARPRVVTIEQTAGLPSRHDKFFAALILQIVAHGYSIHWRIINCAAYGLPQARKRVFLIAACPGEKIPPFPLPTHGDPIDDPHLRPYVTINEAIGKIPRNFPNHDIANTTPRNKQPYSGDEPHRSCITTSGGANTVHPCGRRDFTHREFACLQGFPLEHQFGNVKVKHQIGNAVPPVVARAFYEVIKKTLLASDGLL
ncbi:S-adenosyl-L-methionine-dependent methyltransferase [Xylona heveae TC161]|uniref:DNA (cytosine-5-)-methyltransferase n=1 Tax=Xylona heveae (strain CBS 132557 / TC161) TaxID=1328760 RepID=A0A165FC19_XYLHT|nr:S-adenosyl-L-methionine-dependent methyltransferase [Xylona heveae TC161]KZF20806.1 S-adenosyl-L-methionine-dependent methyltransferase [Xylona heveae TC161]